MPARWKMRGSGNMSDRARREKALSPEQKLARATRRSFLGLGAAAAAGLGGWWWLRSGPYDGGVSGPLRGALNFDRQVTSSALFSDRHLSPEYPTSAIGDLKVNEDLGLEDDLVAADWRLDLQPFGSNAGRNLTMDDIRSLPKVGFTTEFKCIEGWSTVVQWGGARFRDFIAKFAPGSEKVQYASLTTPDNQYYVGIDMESALHPQTLLCYERNGAPLEEEHGAPVRLVIPVKYGIKNLKRIGSIGFGDTPPRDYWSEHGYDYYAGL
jgi:hypothetical protein